MVCIIGMDYAGAPLTTVETGPTPLPKPTFNYHHSVVSIVSKLNDKVFL